MATKGQAVFYYSQPESALVANPAVYLGPSVQAPGKHVLFVMFAPLGGAGAIVQDECALVTEEPVAGDFSEANLVD